jgi:hypothetical protein
VSLITTQNFNQNPGQFLQEAEQMPDSSYNDVMNMIGSVGNMSNNMNMPGMGMGMGMQQHSPHESLSQKLEDAKDPVDVMDAFKSLQKHHHHHAHYPTTRLAHAVHLIHQKMNQRKAAMRRRKYGYHPKRRAPKDRVTEEMMDQLLGKPASNRKLGLEGGMGMQGGMGMPGGMGLNPGALQNISNVMSGNNLLHSEQMPLNDISNLDGAINENSTMLGTKGLGDLSKKMMNQFMPKIQRDVDREMRHRFGNNYMLPHRRMHHRHHHHHHHHRPSHSKH